MKNRSARCGSGEPRTSKKFSLAKMRLELNAGLHMDVMYWAEYMMLHIVDTATNYSELGLLGIRRVEKILSRLNNEFFLKHGSREEIHVDKEFDKNEVHRWAWDNGSNMSWYSATPHLSKDQGSGFYYRSYWILMKK